MTSLFSGKVGAKAWTGPHAVSGQAFLGSKVSPHQLVYSVPPGLQFTQP